METINTELILADLQTIEKALPRLEKELRLKKETAATIEAVSEAQKVLDAGQTVFGAGLDPAPLRELHLLTAKPFLYVFNLDEDSLSDDAFKASLSELVAPAEAIFLSAKVESELIEMSDEEALEMLQSMGQQESGLHQLARIGFDTLGLQTYLTAGPEGVARLDDQEGGHRAAGGRRHPHRLRARLHQGRGDRLRGPRGGGVRRGGPGSGQGPDGGQGVRDAGRRRRGVPLQRLEDATSRGWPALRRRPVLAGTV